MKWLAMALIVLGAGLWAVGQVLSSDAIGMFLGLLFGILATLPGAVLVLVAARREAPRRDPFYSPRPAPPPPPPAQLPGPTIIVVRLPDGSKARALLIEGKAEHVAGE